MSGSASSSTGMSPPLHPASMAPSSLPGAVIDPSVSLHQAQQLQPSPYTDATAMHGGYSSSYGAYTSHTGAAPSTDPYTTALSQHHHKAAAAAAAAARASPYARTHPSAAAAGWDYSTAAAAAGYYPRAMRGIYPSNSAASPSGYGGYEGPH